MTKKLLWQLALFALVFINILIVIEYFAPGVASPVGFPGKVLQTLVATVLYGGFLWWKRKRESQD